MFHEFYKNFYGTAHFWALYLIFQKKNLSTLYLLNTGSL